MLSYNDFVSRNMMMTYLYEPFSSEDPNGNPPQSHFVTSDDFKQALAKLWSQMSKI